MAEAPEQSLPPVIRDLLLHPQRYSFAQAVRLLRLWARPQSAGELEAFLRDRLRFRPALSLAFAVSDVTALDVDLSGGASVPSGEAAPFDKARLTATFLGLYGASSPLPKFYTERLLDEYAEDGSVARDFLDIFNNEFFRLRALLSSYAHPLYRHASGYDSKTEGMLMALAGFGNTALSGRLPDEQIFLRYAGFFFQRTRTASGLRAILADASGCGQIRVRCNVLRLARVPDAQRLRLGQSGAMLGEEATLGEAVPCHEGKIIVEVEALDERALRRLLPGSRLSALLHALLRNYCREPLDYAVIAHLVPGEARPACLGGYGAGRFATLGRDAWIGFGGADPSLPLPAVRADFPAGWEEK